MQDLVLRPEIRLTEAVNSARSAPHSITFTAEVLPTTEQQPALAAGRFLLLYDASEPDEWGGQFRVVTFLRAGLEPDLGEDPLLSAVGWSWLVEALTDRQAQFEAAAGTVTKVVSESFADLADRPAGCDLEIRASWTPTDADLGQHLAAWADLLAVVAGLEPITPGVRFLPTRPAPSS